MPSFKACSWTHIYMYHLQNHRYFGQGEVRYKEIKVNNTPGVSSRSRWHALCGQSAFPMIWGAFRGSVTSIGGINHWQGRATDETQERHRVVCVRTVECDNNIHGANMWQAPDGRHVGPVNFAIWDVTFDILTWKWYVTYCPHGLYLYPGIRTTCVYN